MKLILAPLLSLLLMSEFSQELLALTCCLCLISYLSWWTFPELGGGDPWISTSFPGPLFSPRAISHEVLINRSLKRIICALLKSKVVVLLTASVPPQDPEDHHDMAPAAQAASDFPVSDQFFGVCKYEVQQNIFPCWFPMLGSCH